MCENSPETNSNRSNRDEIYKFLKKYEEEITEMETAIRQLGLLDEMGNLRNIVDEPLEKLKNVQMRFKTHELSTNAVCLSYANNLTKNNGYSSFMNMHISNLSKLADQTEKENLCFKKDLANCGDTINNILSFSNKDVKLLQERAECYRAELAKCEAKYPALKDSQFNVEEIDKEVKKLDGLMREKDELMKDLEQYNGLKPDLDEAHRQVEEIKQESERINKKLLQKKE